MLSARPSSAEEALARRLLSEKRLADVRLARALGRLSASGLFRREGSSSLSQWGERRGLSARETRSLLDLGRALEASPPLEAKVLAGMLSVEAAAELGKMLSDPSLLVPGDDWVSFAEGQTTRELVRAVRKRIEEVHRKGALVEVVALLSTKGKDAFDRAREIASRSAERLLSEGETVEVLAEHYLEGKDPLRKEPGRRRLPDTAEIPGERYIPAAVRREVSGRTRDGCQVPCCGHRVWVHYAHRRAHALGGDREAQNLLRLCRRHHEMLDAGTLRAEGPSDAPRFYTRDGREVGPRAPPS